jgi:hypothetical protein
MNLMGSFRMQNSELPHLLDPMHIEKNVIVSLIRTLSNAKGTKSDSLAVRQELEARNMMPTLHPKNTNQVDKDGNPIYKYAKPAPWVWSPAEFQIVLDIFKNVRAPSNYGSSLSYKIGVKKMVGFKTHDWHNVLHDLLPIAIRGTVYRLSSFFKKLCAKQVKVDDIILLDQEAAELYCFMEMNLPPSFFDIQPHLIVHLPKEVLMAGPVRPRWMYFVERHLKVLKGWVKQMARPESSITEGYVTNEALKFATEYCPGLDSKWSSAWMQDDDKTLSSESLPNAYTEKVLSDVVYEQAHKFVLFNHPAMEKWTEKYSVAKEDTPSLPPFRHWVRGAVLGAMKNGEFITQEALDISAGPSAKVQYFTGKYNIFYYFCFL